MKRLVFFLCTVFSICSCMNAEKFSVVGLGQTVSYPNAVVLNVSGINPCLETEWYLEGLLTCSGRESN